MSVSASVFVFACFGVFLFLFFVCFLAVLSFVSGLGFLLEWKPKNTTHLSFVVMWTTLFGSSTGGFSKWLFLGCSESKETHVELF